MRINVLLELRQPVGFVAEVYIRERSVRITDAEVKDLAGSLVLLRTDRGLLASFDSQATMLERCARCLAPIDFPVSIRFKEEYIPEFDANSGARLPVTTGDEGFSIGPDFVLDLREPLRQYVLMSEPLKPLCRPECAGLCPSCGADLNSRPCECTPAVDDRWRALTGFNAAPTKGN